MSEIYFCMQYSDTGETSDECTDFTIFGDYYWYVIILEINVTNCFPPEQFRS